VLWKQKTGLATGSTLLHEVRILMPVYQPGDDDCFRLRINMVNHQVRQNGRAAAETRVDFPNAVNFRHEADELRRTGEILA